MNPYISINRQKGTSLIEALVSVTLIGMLSSGAIYMSAVASSSQGQLRVQEMAISQLRSALIDNGSNGSDICSSNPTITLPNNIVLTAPQVQVQGCNSEITATINGVDILIPEPLVISIEHETLGGQIVVGGTWVE